MLVEHTIERTEYERADARAADGDAHGERATLVEVVADTDDGRHVDEAEADAHDHADRQVQRDEVLDEAAEEEADEADQRADHGRQPTAQLVRQYGRYWA